MGMTDSNATELRKLCELLDERGIEWTKGDAAYQIEWTNPNGQSCSAMYWKPTLSVLIGGCTPEQAIAATLGNGTCEVTRDFKCSNCGNQVGTVSNCVMVETCDGRQEWKSLDHKICDIPNYCPDCGAKVVKR